MNRVIGVELSGRSARCCNQSADWNLKRTEEIKEYPYLYLGSVSEARQYNELDRWRESHRLNIACREAIEEAIRAKLDGSRRKRLRRETAVSPTNARSADVFCTFHSGL